MKHVLIIDDDKVLLTLLSSFLKKSGFDVTTATEGNEGLKKIKLKNPDLVITDFEMPGLSGLEVVKGIVNNYPGLPVIMLTCHSDVSLTIKSIQAGAYDYIEKPIQTKKLLEIINNGIQASQRVHSLKEKVAFPVRKIIEDNLLVGNTPAIRDIVKNIGRISMHKMSVLITGDKGTGKERAAHLIHYSGITRDQPFITVNCETTDEEKLEQELFGYYEDTSPDSKKNKPGKFELSNEGTLYIKEFHLMTLHLQNKILKVINENQFEKPGIEITAPFKARIIASTSANIDELIENGTILSQLYYYLKVFTIHIPALKYRIDDLPELIDQLIDKLNRKLFKNIKGVEDSVISLLKSHTWPGNITELENTIAQAIVLSKGSVLEKEHFKKHLNSYKKVPDEIVKVPLEKIEKEHIQKVLEMVNWIKQDAATILNISRPTLNAKIKKYNIKNS